MNETKALNKFNQQLMKIRPENTSKYFERRTKMKVLNIYSSNTGNTEKVAKKISETVEMLNFEVDTINIREDYLILISWNMILFLRAQGFTAACPPKA
jgi:flavorubredoxin